MATGNIFKPRGSIGNLVVYPLGEINVIRTKPAYVNDAKSEKQLIHRAKIKLASRFTKEFYKFIQIGYQETTMDYPSNEARSYLMRNCFDLTPSGPKMLYPLVKISRGNIKKPENCVVSTTDDQMQISWKKPEKKDYTDPSDKVMVALLAEEEDALVSHQISTTAFRKDGSVTLDIPAHNNPLQVWMFFSNSDVAVGESKDKISDSVWVGEVL
jgi:hypothetical protein